MVVCAGLFASSFEKLTTMDLGFRVSGLSEARLAPLQFTAMGDFAGDKTPHEVTDRVRWVSTKPDTLAINERTGLATPGFVADTVWVTAVDDATSEPSE